MARNSSVSVVVSFRKVLIRVNTFLTSAHDVLDDIPKRIRLDWRQTFYNTLDYVYDFQSVVHIMCRLEHRVEPHDQLLVITHITPP